MHLKENYERQNKNLNTFLYLGHTTNCFIEVRGSPNDIPSLNFQNGTNTSLKMSF